MPRPRSNTADQLIEVAERHFAERGYEAASLNDIAAEVGIRTPSLYSHFNSKQALYEAVFERRLAPLLEKIERVGIFPDDARESSERIREVVNHLQQHPHLARLCQYAVLSGGESVQVLMDKVYRPLFAIMRATAERQPGHEQQFLALQFLAFHSMIFGFHTYAPLYRELLQGDPADDAVVEAHIQLLEVMAGAGR